MSHPTLAPQCPHPEDIALAMRQMLRGQAKSVAIVTMNNGEQKYAMTATAVTEVSLAPPSLLVCLNQSTNMGAAIKVGDIFGVNFLADDQAAYSDACGGGGDADQKFALAGWTDDQAAPILTQCFASILLQVAHIHSHGSHHIVIGDVQALQSRPDALPLLYQGGQYRAFQNHN